MSQAIAAVLTTALIAAPLIAPPPGGVDVSSETTLPAQSFAGVVAAVAVDDTIDVPGRPTRARALARTRVRGEGRLVASALPAVAMQPAAIDTVADARVAMAAERTTSRKPLSRKVAGWLIGDGTLTVRPFPMVASVRQ